MEDTHSRSRTHARITTHESDTKNPYIYLHIVWILNAIVVSFSFRCWLLFFVFCSGASSQNKGYKRKRSPRKLVCGITVDFWMRDKYRSASLNRMVLLEFVVMDDWLADTYTTACQSLELEINKLLASVECLQHHRHTIRMSTMIEMHSFFASPILIISLCVLAQSISLPPRWASVGDV